MEIGAWYFAAAGKIRNAGKESSWERNEKELSIIIIILFLSEK